MKILVPTKRVPDTDQKIRLSADSLGLDEAYTTYVVNPFDAIALEEALRMREAAEEQGSEAVEILAIGIGIDDYEKELRTALAMGADRAMLVACDTVLDPWNVATILAATVAREQPDLVHTGGNLPPIRPFPNAALELSTAGNGRFSLYGSMGDFRQYALDVRGEICPYPMMRAVEAMKKAAKTHETVEVVTDHAPSLETIPPQAKRLGFQVAIEEVGAPEWNITLTPGAGS